MELNSITIGVTGHRRLENTDKIRQSVIDISMIIDCRRIGFEVQVSNEGEYPERSLYYWAREYSSALQAGGEYIGLPRTIIISILGLKLFDCDEYYSEHMALEVTRHTLLTDRLCLKYYELPKLPDTETADDEWKETCIASG